MMSDPNQGVPAAAGPPPVLAYPMQAQSKIYDKYRSKTSISTGSGQIVIGVLCIIFNIVDLAVFKYTRGFGYVGHGFWCGVMFIVTGGFGIAAGKYKTKCQIIPYMVMCIISASCTVALLVVGIMGAAAAGYMIDYETRDCNRYGYYNDYPYYYPRCSNVDGYRVSLAMEVLLAIAGLIEVILAIKGSTICCRSGICCCNCESCCCVSDSPNTIPVGYLSNNGQLVYINPTQVVQYVSLPQTVMSGSGAPPPPNVPSYTQFGWSAPPPQPPSTGVPSAQAEPPPEYAAEYPGNSKTADDKLLLWP